MKECKECSEEATWEGIVITKEGETKMYLCDQAVETYFGPKVHKHDYVTVKIKTTFFKLLKDILILI